MLSSITLLCYVRIVFALVRQGERLHAALAVLQIIVLVASISGFIAGHH